MWVRSSLNVGEYRPGWHQRWHQRLECLLVVIPRPNLKTFAAGDLLRGSTEEKVHAAETYVSYCGQYELPVYGRPARRQPSGVAPWARLKVLTK